MAARCEHHQTTICAKNSHQFRGGTVSRENFGSQSPLIFIKWHSSLLVVNKPVCPSVVLRRNHHDVTRIQRSNPSFTFTAVSLLFTALFSRSTYTAGPSTCDRISRLVILNIVQWSVESISWVFSFNDPSFWHPRYQFSIRDALHAGTLFFKLLALRTVFAAKSCFFLNTVLYFIFVKSAYDYHTGNGVLMTSVLDILVGKMKIPRTDVTFLHSKRWLTSLILNVVAVSRLYRSKHLFYQKWPVMTVEHPNIDFFVYLLCDDVAAE